MEQVKRGYPRTVWRRELNIFLMYIFRKMPDKGGDFINILPIIHAFLTPVISTEVYNLHCRVLLALNGNFGTIMRIEREERRGDFIRARTIPEKATAVADHTRRVIEKLRELGLENCPQQVAEELIEWKKKLKMDEAEIVKKRSTYLVLLEARVAQHMLEQYGYTKDDVARLNDIGDEENAALRKYLDDEEKCDEAAENDLDVKVARAEWEAEKEWMKRRHRDELGTLHIVHRRMEEMRKEAEQAAEAAREKERLEYMSVLLIYGQYGHDNTWVELVELKGKFDFSQLVVKTQKCLGCTVEPLKCKLKECYVTREDDEYPTVNHPNALFYLRNKSSRWDVQIYDTEGLSKAVRAEQAAHGADIYIHVVMPGTCTEVNIEPVKEIAVE
jgi:hypothetical protein